MLIKSRVEEKFIIPKIQQRQIENYCEFLKPDSSDSYYVTSIYFTCSILEDMLYRNTDRVDKYRIRIYPEIREGFDTRMFAEIKSKEKDLRFKQSAPVTELELMQLIQRDYRNFNSLTPLSTRFAVLSEYRRLMPYPVLVISYNRKIYNFGDTRVTFDQKVTAKLFGNKASCMPFGSQIIIEIKYSGGIDVKAIKLRDRLKNKTGASKYMMARQLFLRDKF